MVADSGRPHPFTSPPEPAHRPPVRAAAYFRQKDRPATAKNPAPEHQRAHIRHYAVYRKPVGFRHEKALIYVTFVTYGLLPHSRLLPYWTEKLRGIGSSKHNSGLLSLSRGDDLNPIRPAYPAAIAPPDWP